MTIRIQWRRGAAAEWTAANTVLSSAEAGFETDTLKFKVGDGATAWNDLAYFVGEQGPQGNALKRPLGVLAVVAGIVTVDLSQPYEVYDLALTANASIVFTNPPAAGKVAEVRIVLAQGAAAAYTCTFGAAAKKFAGGAWVVSSALGAVESLGVAIRSDGSITVFPSGVYA